MRKLIAGNWKMNGTQAALVEVEALLRLCAENLPAETDVLLCPPATLVGAMASLCAGSGVMVGGQDCHSQSSGPHTGDVSADMFADLGAGYVIVGHSERRADCGETDAVVRAKAEATQKAGLVPIICVGETREEREAGKAVSVVCEQLAGSLPQQASGQAYVIAYEPVWAIGTGLVPTKGDIAEIHEALRASTPDPVQILYGGSVKPANAVEILSIPNVNGALVGGASLKAKDFYGIVSPS